MKQLWSGGIKYLESPRGEWVRLERQISWHSRGLLASQVHPDDRPISDSLGSPDTRPVKTEANPWGLKMKNKWEHQAQEIRTSVYSFGHQMIDHLMVWSVLHTAIHPFIPSLTLLDASWCDSWLGTREGAESWFLLARSSHSNEGHVYQHLQFNESAKERLNTFLDLGKWMGELEIMWGWGVQADPDLVSGAVCECISVQEILKICVAAM